MKINLSLSLLLFSIWLIFVSQTNPAPTEKMDQAILDSLMDNEQYEVVTPLLYQQLTYCAQRKSWKEYRSHLLDLARSLNSLRRFDSLRIALDQGLTTLIQAGKKDSAMIGRIWTWQALNYACMDNYTEALSAYQQAFRVYEINQMKGSFPAYSYKNGAQIYMRRQDYTQANEYLEAAYRVDTAQEHTQSILTQIANNFYWQKNLDAAWTYYQKGLKAPSMGPIFDASLFATGGALLIKKQQFREAHALYKRAMAGFLTSPLEFDNVIRCHTAFAEIAQNTQNTALAEKEYKAAESLGKANYKGKCNREMAKLYCEWGDFCKKTGSTQEALQKYQQAMIQSWPEFNSNDLTQNPDPAQKTPMELWAMNAPARKAAMLLSQTRISQQDRENAAACFELAFIAAEQLRQVYDKNETKLYLQENNYNLRQEASLNLWELYKTSNTPEILYKTFDLIESGRAAVLRDALRQQNALQAAGAPDSLLQQESNLRREIASINNDLLESTDAKKLKDLKINLFEAERLHQQLLSQIEEQYPRFSTYNKAGERVPARTLQTALSDSSTIYSWLDAGDKFLCICLRKNNIQGFEVPKNGQLDSLLQSYQALLRDKNAQQNNPDAFFETSHLLFSQLFPPNTLSIQDKKLVIIPDGQLCYIPFETLLTQAYSGAFANAPWMLRQYNIRYHWSASLLAYKQQGKANKSGMLHLAPFVDSQRGEWATLSNSNAEIPENVASNQVINQAASADAFLTKAPAFETIHFSTHAGIDQSGQLGIEMSDRALRLPEIYASQLSCSLVSLSACETGIGQLSKGEGVLSLARAFAYAGVRNLAASFWKVNDRSTAQLFDAFYTKLMQGEALSAAFKDAKLDYLNSAIADHLKSPWYWAAFTLTGEDGQLELPQKRRYWPFFLALICLIPLLLWRFKTYPLNQLFRMKTFISIVFGSFLPFVLLAQTAPAPDSIASAEFIASTEGKGVRFKPVLPPLGQVAGASKAFYTYHWEFGDGDFSREESPVHIYAKPGQYTAMLCATNAYDDKNPPKDKSKDIYADNSGAVAGKNNVFKTPSHAISLKSNRDARRDETLTLTLSYQNVGKEATAGRVYLFYNEKVFKTAMFEYNSARTHYGETKVPPQYTGTEPTEDELNYARWATSYHTSATGASIRILSDDTPTPTTEMVSRARAFFRDEQNWSFTQMAPGEQRNMFVTLLGTKSMLKDTTALIHIRGIFAPDNPLVSPQEFTLELKIVSSHDPNAIAVSDCRVNYRFLGSKKLDYKVEFQNNGEGPAKKIELTITMPQGLNLGKMRPVEWYPKCPICPKTPGTQSCLDTATSDGKLIFTFRNIALPGSRQKGMDYDSTKGFVRYRIEPDKNMPKYSFRSQAKIIFDKNPPIYTNFSKTRFKPGLSPGPKIGYNFHPDSINNGYIFIGMSMSTYKSWKIYPQVEILTGFRGKEELRARTTQMVLRDTQGVDFRTDTTVTTTLGGNRGFVNFEIPFLLRKNFNRFVGAGIGASARITLENGDNEITTQRTLQQFVIDPNGTVTYVPFGDPITQPPTSTLSSHRATRIRYTIFGDLTIGSVRAGPNLGIRGGVLLGNTKITPFIQLSVEIKI